MAAGESIPAPGLTPKADNTDQDRAKYTQAIPCGPMSVEDEAEALPGGFTGGQAGPEPLSEAAKAARGH